MRQVNTHLITNAMSHSSRIDFNFNLALVHFSIQQLEIKYLPDSPCRGQLRVINGRLRHHLPDPPTPLCRCHNAEGLSMLEKVC